MELRYARLLHCCPSKSLVGTLTTSKAGNVVSRSFRAMPCRSEEDETTNRQSSQQHTNKKKIKKKKSSSLLTSSLFYYYYILHNNNTFSLVVTTSNPKPTTTTANISIVVMDQRLLGPQLCILRFAILPEIP